jgi:hypothetical protein
MSGIVRAIFLPIFLAGFQNRLDLTSQIQLRLFFWMQEPNHSGDE